MKLERVKPELTFSTSCASSPPPSIRATGLDVDSGSSLLCFGVGRMLVRDDAIEVMVRCGLLQLSRTSWWHVNTNGCRC